MKPAVKVAIIAGGYLLALLLAVAVVALHMALDAESDAGAQASGGMAAFGDAVLFVAVFGVAAMVPTGVAVFLFWPRRKSLSRSSHES